MISLAFRTLVAINLEVNEMAVSNMVRSPVAAGPRRRPSLRMWLEAAIRIGKVKEDKQRLTK